MAEPRDRLTDAFTDLAVTMMREVHLPGPAAAHTTIRQRHRRRLAIVAAAVALLIAAPTTAIALLRDTVNPDPNIGNTPTPTVTVSPSPSTSASPEPPRLRVISDAHQRETTPLDNALLPIPSFGSASCPEGEIQYTDGIWHGEQLLADPPTYVTSTIYAIATGDVNRDGNPDWIAGIGCWHGLYQGGSVDQLVAFTEDGAGSYRPIGQVIVGDGNSGISWPEVSADGIVRAVISGPFEPAGFTTHEWHAFRWDGSEFRSVGSPVAIPETEPTDLRLAVTPSTVSGQRTALTITIQNAGRTTTDILELSFAADDSLPSLSIRPDGFPAELKPVCNPMPSCSWSVRLEPVAVGESASAVFTVTLDDPSVVRSLQVSVAGRVPGHVFVPNLTSQNVVTLSVDPD